MLVKPCLLLVSNYFILGKYKKLKCMTSMSSNKNKLTDMSVCQVDSKKLFMKYFQNCKKN